MRLGVADCGIASNIQSCLLKAGGKGFCVGDHIFLILVAKGIHLVRRHQEAQHRAEVMIAHRARERARLDGLPEVIFQLVLFVVDRDHAALRAKEGFMRRAGDNLRALLKRLLEMRPDETQHMRHVVHDGGVDLLLVHKRADLADRLFMQHHRLAEDDEFRLVTLDDLLGLFHVNLEEIFAQDREIDHGGFLRCGIYRDIVMQGAHRLRAEMSALDDVVVEDVAKPLRGVLAVKAVFIVHQRGEHGCVAHLSADHARLYLGAVKILAQLRDQRALDLVDKLRALIIEHLVVIERRSFLMLGIAEARVAAAEQTHRAGDGHLRGNEVDALLLPPDVVVRGFTQKIQRAERQVGGGLFLRLLRRVHHDGSRIRRRVRAQVPGGHYGADSAAADIDLHCVVGQHIGIQQRETNRTHRLLVGKRLQEAALVLHHITRHHRSARDIADLLAILIDGETRAEHAPAGQRNRSYPAW